MKPSGLPVWKFGLICVEMIWIALVIILLTTGGVWLGRLLAVWALGVAR